MKLSEQVAILEDLASSLSEQLAKRPDTEYVARLERLVELLTPEIMLLVANQETVVDRLREIPKVYRDLCELRPKE